MDHFTPFNVEPLDNPFWQFSLSSYAHTEVQNCAHLLQEQYGANVNLLLYCCWLAYAVEDVSEQLFVTACQSVTFWQEHITQPLRRVRKARASLGDEPWCKAFFTQILADELLSESYQQQLLYQQVQERLMRVPRANPERAHAYLLLLLQAMNCPVDKLLHLQLHDFVAAVYLGAN